MSSRTWSPENGLLAKWGGVHIQTLNGDDLPGPKTRLAAIQTTNVALQRHTACGASAERAGRALIPFGSAGYVALFEIDDRSHVSILAVRHQREEDYH